MQSVTFIHLNSVINSLFQVTGASRLADILFVGFLIKPSHRERTQELRPEDIDIEAIVSPQVHESAAFLESVDQIRTLVVNNLAIPHVKGFPWRLSQVTDHGGYIVSPQSKGKGSSRSANDRPQVCVTYHTGIDLANAPTRPYWQQPI